MPLFETQRDKFEEPSSAISLAISAILALIPCPQDPNPLEPDAIRWRRTYSQFLAKAALESIETETERPESSVEPPKALDDSDEDILREKFHSQVPLELESIIALDLLSVYEYAQRGNLKKMRARVGAALVAAMSLTLHTRNDVEDEYTEARRRTWWMTYMCVCQGSIVSNTVRSQTRRGSIESLLIFTSPQRLRSSHLVSPPCILPLRPIQRYVIVLLHSIPFLTITHE